VLLPGADHDIAGQVAQRLLRAMGEPFGLGTGEPVCVGLSMGIAVCPQDGRDTQALLRQADEALYRAKHAGKGCYRWAGQGA
jgi:diguanylate cyclase (GGDEF)-like protein